MPEISGKFTLLLVDDNPTNLMLLAQIIELDLPQVRVLTARSARAGLALVEREQVDGAFIDVQMPQMSGLDMCRRLKANSRLAGMPLVLMTAHIASPEMRAEGLEVGAYDFISQPISNIEMLARIKVMLRLCQNERSLHSGQSVINEDKDLAAKLRWASGLLLSGEGQAAETDQRVLKSLTESLPDPTEINEQFFVEKLLDLLPQPWQQTFLKLALLGTVPFSLARKISEIDDIEAAIEYLKRQGVSFSTSVAGEEQIHFSTQLRKQLESRVNQILAPDKSRQCLCSAADWYQQKGDLSAALQCLIRAENYPAVSQLLSQAGLSLLADRFQPQVFELLAQVPEKVAAGCAWLSMYAGILCMQRSPVEVDAWLELARTRFEVNGDDRGELMALSRQVIQFLLADGRQELGQQQLPRFHELADQQLAVFEPENRLKILFALGMAELFFAGNLARADEFLQRGLAEAQREGLIEEQLDFHLLQTLLALYQGRFRVARSAFEQANSFVGQLSRQALPVWAFSIIACDLLFTTGDLDGFDQQRARAERQWGKQTLKLSAFGPMLNYFSILARLARGKTESAEEQLEIALKEGPAASNPHPKSLLLQLRGFLKAQQGLAAAAAVDSGQALELRQRVGGELNGLPNLLLAGATSVLLQSYDLATEQLEQGLKKSQQLTDDRYRSGFHAWLALLHQRRGETEQALEHLAQLFENLARKQTDFFFAQTPELVRELLPLVKGCPDWAAQVQRLVNNCLDATLNESGHLVPLARLQVLGGFKLHAFGKICDLSLVGQAPRQIMALLAVSPNGSLSTELLMGALWPDSPPSRARNSFDTALSRLRKVLEDCFGNQLRQDYLTLEKGMLLLQNVQIDSMLFCAQLETARRHLQRQNIWQAELAFRKADQSWQGEFLAGFDLDADLPYRRENLTQLRLEQLSGLARLLQFRGETDEAIRLLRLGLQLEPTQDSLVQQLLSLYHQQGEKRAMRQLLDGFRKALETEDYEANEIAELIEALSPQRLEF